MDKSTNNNSNIRASSKVNNRKMDFFQGSPNAFQAPNGMPFAFSPYLNGVNGFAPINANANQFATASAPQQWQSPLINNPQLWSHNVPNVMPWSCPGSNPPEGIFAFSPPPSNPLFNAAEPIPPSAFPSSSPFVNQPMAPTAPTPQPQQSLPPQPPMQQLPFSDGSLPTGPFAPSPSPGSMFESSLNQNNKRHVSPLDEDIDIDVDFDFESKRPVKKYISEDKVLEIFDRLHIREGDHYIVEDVVEDARNTSNYKHNVVIEVLEDEEDHVLELSPELKNAFQNRGPCITEKMIQREKDKMSKALVVWKPNPILQTLLSETTSTNDTNSEPEDNENDCVQIEEIFDEDEEMLNCEGDGNFIEPANEEEDNLELME